MKKKKLKLNFEQLQENRQNVLTFAELRGIVGGFYSIPLFDWDTVDAFLSNLNELIAADLFNYSGTSDYDSGFFTFPTPSSGASGSTSFSFGSLFNTGGSSTFSLNFGQPQNSNLLSFSSGNFASNSNVFNAGPLNVNFGTGTADLSFGGGLYTNPQATIKVNGKEFTFEKSGSEFKFSIKIGF